MTLSHESVERSIHTGIVVRGKINYSFDPDYFYNSLNNVQYVDHLLVMEDSRLNHN